MKVHVPPAPVPSRPLNGTVEAPKEQREPEALDAKFMQRCLGWTLALGTGLSLAVWGVTNAAAGGSFALGVILGAALLGSEIALIGRVLQAASAKKRGDAAGTLFLGMLWVLKWVPVGVGIWWLTRQSWFAAPAFAMGCLVFQIVIFAKAAGRLIVR